MMPSLAISALLVAVYLLPTSASMLCDRAFALWRLHQRLPPSVSGTITLFFLRLRGASSDVATYVLPPVTNTCFPT